MSPKSPVSDSTPFTRSKGKVIRALQLGRQKAKASQVVQTR